MKEVDAMSIRTKIFLILAAVFLLSITTQSNADDLKFGARAGFYSDGSNAFIGGEVLVPAFGDSWYFNPNVEYVFADAGNLWTFNFDFHHDFHTDGPFYLWLGAGPSILYFNPDRPARASDTDFGVNLLGGIGFRLSHSDLIPYIQPKVILSNNSQFSLAFGLRF
jgi:hypothetical protein